MNKIENTVFPIYMIWHRVFLQRRNKLGMVCLLFRSVQCSIMFFLPDQLPDLMNTNDKEQEIYSIKEDDILITRTSETIDELAMSCVALKDYPTATYSGFTKRLRPKCKGITDSKYLALYLRGYLFRKAVTNNAFMTLRASFNEDIFSFLSLYLPEYEQQKRIGNLLYLTEKKIQLNYRLTKEVQKCRLNSLNNSV